MCAQKPTDICTCTHMYMHGRKTNNENTEGHNDCVFQLICEPFHTFPCRKASLDKQGRHKEIVSEMSQLPLKSEGALLCLHTKSMLWYSTDSFTEASGIYSLGLGWDGDLPPVALSLMVISSSETLTFLIACALRGHPDKLWEESLHPRVKCTSFLIKLKSCLLSTIDIPVCSLIIS